MAPGEPDVATLLEKLASWRPPWMSQAACRGSTANFFPGAGESLDAAREVCSVCPVRAPCAAYALENDLQGVWAGTSQRERRRSRQQAA